jgi:hypothetical protein
MDIEGGLGHGQRQDRGNGGQTNEPTGSSPYGVDLSVRTVDSGPHLESDLYRISTVSFSSVPFLPSLTAPLSSNPAEILCGINNKNIDPQSSQIDANSVDSLGYQVVQSRGESESGRRGNGHTHNEGNNNDNNNNNSSNTHNTHNIIINDKNNTDDNNNRCCSSTNDSDKNTSNSNSNSYRESYRGLSGEENENDGAMIRSDVTPLDQSITSYAFNISPNMCIDNNPNMSIDNNPNMSIDNNPNMSINNDDQNAN